MALSRVFLDKVSWSMRAHHFSIKPCSIRFLHWSVAVLVTIALASGYRAFDFSWSGRAFFDRDLLFMMHRSAGLLTAILVLIWLVIRAPVLWRHRVGLDWYGVIVFGHIAIAALAFATAVLGWVGRSLGGRSAEMFSLLPVHNLVAKGEGAHVYVVFELHKALVPWLLWLAGLHIAATMVHAFVLRDNLFASMVSSRLKR